MNPCSSRQPLAAARFLWRTSRTSSFHTSPLLCGSSRKSSWELHASLIRHSGLRSSCVAASHLPGCTSASSPAFAALPASPAGTRALSSVSENAAAPTSVLQWMGIYNELSKGKLSAFVVMTTGAGYLFGGTALSCTDLQTLAATCVGTFLCSASANTCNQIYEVRTDALMKRTAKRPLPAQRITKQHAAAWAALSGASGVSLLFAAANPLTAALGLANIGLYAGVYTPLKQITPANTWVGAVVGAIPPVMGWTAAGGALWSVEAAVLSAGLFFWQMPHFFALSWLYRKDYADGGYRMISYYDPSGSRTASLCLEYSLYLATLPLLTTYAGLTSSMFAVEGVVYNGLLLGYAWRFNQSPSQANARRLFLASLGYLPLFFALLLFHQKSESRLQKELGEECEHDQLDKLHKGHAELRTKGRELCMHERLISGSDNKAENAARCPTVIAESMVAHTKEAVREEAEVAWVVASVASQLTCSKS